MANEKKFWTVPNFTRRSGNRNPPKTNTERSGRCISTVYLSGGSPSCGLVIVPEFDEPVTTTRTMHKELAVLAPSSPHPDRGERTTGSNTSPYSHHHGTSVGDDLEQRLGSAYQHIRGMTPPRSPRVVLSLDPQMRRKQLGVPQHSVLNYPISSSPDLPNPHPSPSSSPSKKPAVRVDTSTDAFHQSTPTQGTISNTAVGDITACSRPQRDVLTETSTFHSYHSSLPIKLPKFTKRRRDSHPPGVSSLPSFGSGWPSLNMMKKPPGESRSSTGNEHKRQISLPQIRSPSPFRVNIPLHHSWHERRTKFNFSSDAAPPSRSRKRRTSESTEVLASLAWIGTPPMSSGSALTPEGNADFFVDCTDLSAAIAVDDENISNDILVGQLEKIRRIDSQTEECNNSHFLKSAVDSGPPRADLFAFSPTDQLPPPCQLQYTNVSHPPSATPDSEDAIVWESARKTLFCIREIARTEKKYQEALRMLLNAQTTTPPPPSMSPYVSALLHASDMLLKGFLQDPSAWGVSTTFVACEDELDATMVSWCTIAGTFFTDCNDTRPGRPIGRWRLRRPVVSSGDNSVAPTRSSSPSGSQSSSISLSPSAPPVLPPINAPSGTFGDATREEQYLQAHMDMQLAASTLPCDKRRVAQSHVPTDQRSGRKLSVRDIAIQPVQRIMRYVLLYRDLLHCTPRNCPSRLLVERALEAAVRIASRCDQAQSNPAFCFAS